MNKKLTITLFYLVMAVICINAQNDRRFTIKAGSSVADVLSAEEIYRYPAFTEGHVLYKNGTGIDSRLNYNIVLGEMVFINGRGDTMVIANSAEIKMVIFPADTFYVNEGYLEMLEGDTNIMLLAKNYVKFMDVKNQGAYGTSNSTGAVDNYTIITAGNNTSTMNLKVNQDMVYSFKTDFFIKKRSSEYLPVRKNNLMKMFPDNKNEIKGFLKENNINFTDMSDLVKLTGFLMQL